MLGGNISTLNLTIFKPQNWNICRLLVVLIANRLGINIKTGGTYGDTKIVGKWVNKTGRPPNGIDIIRVNLLLSITTFMLLALILLIQNT